MGLFDFLSSGRKNKLDTEEDEEYLKRHRKLQGIILVYGPKGSGKTSLMKIQLNLDVFRTYYVIAIGDPKNYTGIQGVDAIIDEKQISSLSDLKKQINKILKEEKVKSAVIVFDDADDLSEKIGTKLWKYVSSMSHKHQIILVTSEPPDDIREPQMIVRLFEPGGKVSVFFKGKDRVASNSYSWAQIQTNAIFMVALLE